MCSPSHDPPEGLLMEVKPAPRSPCKPLSPEWARVRSRAPMSVQTCHDLWAIRLSLIGAALAFGLQRALPRPHRRMLTGQPRLNMYQVGTCTTCACTGWSRVYCSLPTADDMLTVGGHWVTPFSRTPPTLAGEGGAGCSRLFG